MDDVKPIIMLSGPIGAGKSTVAKELAASAVNPTVYIEGDTFWNYIIKSAPGYGGQKNFKMIMRSMTAASIPYALSGYDVILDFSIPPWFLDTARKITSRREVPIDYVVLRPAEATCAYRAANRAEGTIADYTLYHELYTAFDEAAAHIISNDTSDAATVAEEIRQGLKAKKFRI